MKCLAEGEVNVWLQERGIPKSPYSGEIAPKYYFQFYAPSEYRTTDAFLRLYYSRILSEDESLIDVTDWSLYLPSEMTAIDGIRRLSSERRRLIDASGHWLTAEEAETGVSLFSLTAAFMWKSYLYSKSDRTTLYNWEGEIFDFWTDSKKVLTELRLLVAKFDLSETKKGEQDVPPKSDRACG